MDIWDTYNLALNGGDMPKGVGMKNAGFVGLMIAKKHLRRNPESYDPNARPKSTPELFDQDLIQAPSKYIKENMYEQSTRIRSAMSKMGDIKKKNIVRRAVKDYVIKWKDRAIGAMGEITPDEMVAFVNQYKRNGVEGVAYSAYDITGEMVWLYLMKKYKNECYIVFRNPKRRTYVSGIDITNNGNPQQGAVDVPELVSTMKDCLEINAPLMVIPLTMPKHQNMMLYRPTANTIERFEPHGERSGHLSPEQNEKMDAGLKKFFERKAFDPIFKRNGIPAFQYLKPQDLRSGKGFQAVENQELREYERTQKKKLGPSYDGFCQMWAFFYLELSMKFPNLTGRQVIDKAFEAINARDGANKFLNLITSYVEDSEKEIKKLYADFSFGDYGTKQRGQAKKEAMKVINEYYKWFNEEVRKIVLAKQQRISARLAGSGYECSSCEY